jgi:cell division protein FtsI (penicillin-binding protein 3)
MKKAVKRNKKQNTRHVAYTRFMLIVAVFVLWIGGISVRLVHLQVNQHVWLKERALGVRQDVKQTRTLRGTIYDRNERAIAISSHVKTLYADATEITDVAATVKAVASVVKIDVPAVTAQLNEAVKIKKRFLPIARKLESEQVEKINKTLDTGVRKADLPAFAGLHWRDDQRRNYPYNTLAAQVVGYSNTEDDGKAGIELAHDDLLHGAVIRKRQERDRLGRVYDEDEAVPERAAPSDIVLTLDMGFQNITEEALAAGVKNAQARSGMVVVMDPKTGEILALANYPTFDPNAYSTAPLELIKNHAIQAVYSPGSVFKLITYGSALERKLISPEAMISSGNGQITVADHTFTDSHGVGTVTYAKALAQSSNVCAIKTALQVGKDDFYGLVRKIGFGSRSGIELPAETAGLLKPVDKWHGDSLASMSIGYEIGVTALQMATAFATIANDGIRVQPHIIKEIRHSNEEPKSVTQVQQTQVVTAATARDLRVMLREVVLSGTGRRAQLNGYTSAGKTGTAWKFNANSKSIDSSKYISSFIGMAPANDPRVLVAVVMDEPKAGARDGGFVSAPVFKEIAQRILEEMKVPMDASVRPESLTAENVAPPKETGPEPVNRATGLTADPKATPKVKAADVPAGQTLPRRPQDRKKAKEEKRTVEAVKLTARRRQWMDDRNPLFAKRRRFET